MNFYEKELQKIVSLGVPLPTQNMLAVPVTANWTMTLE